MKGLALAVMVLKVDPIDHLKVAQLHPRLIFEMPRTNLSPADRRYNAPSSLPHFLLGPTSCYARAAFTKQPSVVMLNGLWQLERVTWP